MLLPVPKSFLDELRLQLHKHFLYWPPAPLHFFAGKNTFFPVQFTACILRGLTEEHYF